MAIKRRKKNAAKKSRRSSKSTKRGPAVSRKRGRR